MLGDIWHLLIAWELEAAISNSQHKASNAKNKMTWTCELKSSLVKSCVFCGPHRYDYARQEDLKLMYPKKDFFKDLSKHSLAMSMPFFKQWGLSGLPSRKVLECSPVTLSADVDSRMACNGGSQSWILELLSREKASQRERMSMGFKIWIINDKGTEIMGGGNKQKALWQFSCTLVRYFLLGSHSLGYNGYF